MPAQTHAQRPASARWRRWLAIALAALVLLEIGYLLAGNGLLRSAWLPRAFGRHPDRFQIHWKEAWTILPGRLHVRGLHLRGQTPAVGWEIVLPEVTGNLDLADLLRRRLTVRGASASGAVVRVLRTAALTRGTAAPGTLAPLTPLPPPVPRRPAAPAGSSRGPWTFSFHGVEASGVREVWVDHWRWARGRIAARGGFVIVPGRRAEVLPGTLELDGVSLLAGEREAMADLKGRARVAIAPFKPHGGLDVFRQVSGRLEITGQLLALMPLEPYLARMPWLSLGGGAGRLAARVDMAHGRFAPGSQARLDTREITVDMLGYRAVGGGALTWRVERGRARLAARLDRFAVNREGASEPYLWGKDLEVEATTADLQIDGSPSRFAVTARMPWGEIPNLRSYNAYLPADSGFEVLGGTARVHAQVAIDEAGRGRGLLACDGATAEARYGALRLRGRFRAAVPWQSADVRTRTFALSGLTARMEGMSIDGKGFAIADWWGEATGAGALRPGAPVYLELDGRTRLKDSLPVLALFTERHLLARALGKLLEGEPAEGSGRLTLGQDHWRISDLKATGGRLALAAELQRAHHQTRGALLASYRRLDLGIELEPRGRRFHLRHARQWFEGLRL